MKYWRFFIFILIAIIFQVAVLPNFFSDIIPNVILLIMVTYLIIGQPQASLWWIASGGLALELFSPYPFGLYIAQFLLIFVILNFYVRPFLHEPPAFLTAIVFFAVSIIFNSAQAIYLHLSLGAYLLNLALIETAFGVILYAFIQRYYQRRSIIKVNV